jgi:arylsulfatase
MAETDAKRPNIILILADDMGFSDLGSYGSEIRTPHLDRLANNGVRFTQMYNSARCCPSRAALLTGINPHQAGIGHMTNNMGVPSYQGYLSDSCATIAEVLKGAGYRTCMSGKWHVGGHPLEDDTWSTPDSQPVTPTRRGFDRYYGLLSGAGSFYNPPHMMDDDKPFAVEHTDYYLTDAITDNAVKMIDESSATDDPFFLYVAYTAPHWPLHALEEDIAKYDGMYRDGWDALRTGRHEEMIGMGLLDPKWQISPRDEDSGPWSDARNREWEAMRMAVYAAQIDRLDQGAGKIMAKLEEQGEADNTLVMFLADNGGCAEFLREDAYANEKQGYRHPTVDGRPMRMGNSPEIEPGPADTFMSYDLPWANASNTPFRLFKRWVHEGGISTPFIAHWPDRIKRSSIVHEPAHIVDITATCIDAASAPYPTELNGNAITPAEGESFLPVIEGENWSREQPIVWEHEGNRAVRVGPWKLVSEYPGSWELYDIDEDRTELHDRSEGDQERVQQMSKLYGEWAERCGVIPWEIIGRNVPMSTIGKHNHSSGHRPR